MRSSLMRRWLYRCMVLLCGVAFLAVALVGPQAAAQDVDATATLHAELRATMAARRTPTPPRYVIHRVATHLIEGVEMLRPGLGGIAVDAEGRLYVGDGRETVIVFSPDLVELHRFAAQQPYALAINSRGDLLIGQRYQVNIGLYDRAGGFVRRFWFQPDALLDALAAGPDDTLYVAWQTINPPRVAYLSRLDPNGNLLFTRELGHPLGAENTVHSIAFAPDGTLILALSGFGVSRASFLAELVAFNPLGDLIREGPRVFMDRGIVAPAAVTYLRDGSLVMFATEFTAWWQADGQLRARISSNDLRDGGVPPSRYAQQAAVALRPDGESIFFAEVRDTGDLQTGIVQFIDALAPPPTASPTGTPAG